MVYTSWQVGEKEYQLRLSAASMVQVERKLGRGIFGFEQLRGVWHLVDFIVGRFVTYYA